MVNMPKKTKLYSRFLLLRIYPDSLIHTYECKYRAYSDLSSYDYALINRARGLYEELFVLRFKAYGPNAVRSMCLECQNKYFLYGPKSRLIRALLYTYTNITVYDEILLS